MHFRIPSNVISCGAAGQCNVFGERCSATPMCGVQKSSNDPIKLDEQCIHSLGFCATPSSTHSHRAVKVDRVFIDANIKRLPALTQQASFDDPWSAPKNYQQPPANYFSSQPVPQYLGPLSVSYPVVPKHINPTGEGSRKTRLRDYSESQEPFNTRWKRQSLWEQDRIIGGTNVMDMSGGQLCWQVLLRIDNSFWCGGSIVGSRTIVTAAHCVFDEMSLTVNSKRLTVQTGVLKYNKMTDESTQVAGCGRSYGVLKVTIHPNYNHDTNNNDVAVLTLKEDIDFSGSCTCQLCLENKEPVQGEICVVSGYGETQDERQSIVLNWVKLKVLSYTLTKCSFVSGMNPDLFICAGDVVNRDSCNGDSGGPFVCWDKSSRAYYLAGIVSFGPSPCGIGLGAQYTKVAKFVRWIRMQLPS